MKLTVNENKCLLTVELKRALLAGETCMTPLAGLLCGTEQIGCGEIATGVESPKGLAEGDTGLDP